MLSSALLLCALVQSQPALAELPLQPVPAAAVELRDRFWASRLHTLQRVTLPHVLQQCESTGRIRNFAVAGKLATGQHEGFYFNDSDLYKVVEGACRLLELRPDAALRARVDTIVQAIAAAQEPDGYLYTARTLARPDKLPPGGKERWSDLGSGHELYCAGHLYEAAVVHHRVTGTRALLDVAVRHAELLRTVFGPGKQQTPDGHPEIELALVALARATGNRAYAELAGFFLEARGRTGGGRGLWGPGEQDHQPVSEQTQAVGHAVRAGYLYCGMADVDAALGTTRYAAALDALWRDVTTSKLYLTGGIGARGGGEAFGAAFELPNRTAYAETCAAVAMGLWSERQFRRSGDGAAVDLLERVLANGFLAGVSLHGDRFFYPNPLESAGAERQPWFDCACCPSTVVRILPQVPGWMYARRGQEVFVNLYAQSTARIALGDGATLTLEQTTDYPWDGRVLLTVRVGQPTAATLHLRVPRWARGAPLPNDLYRPVAPVADPVTLRVNGAPVDAPALSGYLLVARTWNSGDQLELTLPMPAQRLVAHPRVAADQDKVALARGPLIYCAEGVDQPDGRVLDRVLGDAAAVTALPRPDLLGGVVVLQAPARSARRTVERTVETSDEQTLTAVPYFAWAHRGRSPMAVWLARTPAAARPLPAPTLAARSRISTSPGASAMEAVRDQQEPRSSNDHDVPFLHWWPRKGSAEWLQYDFPAATTVSACEVYWFDDTGTGECRVPASWRILAHVGDTWQPVEQPQGLGVGADRWHRATFTPITCSGLRLELQLQAGWSAGVHEWRVE